jgi:alkylhydroperoxidase family enzyme
MLACLTPPPLDAVKRGAVGDVVTAPRWIVGSVPRVVPICPTLTSQDGYMVQPRIAPVTPDECDDKTTELLAGLGGSMSSALNIFTTLAHHPRLLKKWSEFGGVLLYRGELDPREREIVILRTGWNCQSEYEWGQHKAIGLATGLTEKEVDATTLDPAAAGWNDSDALLITAADELHADSKVSDATWAKLAQRYDKKQLIELCMVVGQYHLVAMTLNTLGVVRDDGVEGFPA